MSVSIWEGNKAQALIDAIANTQKVDKQQGVTNAGKALVVGRDGLVGFGIAGIPEEVKVSLLACFRDVAWIGSHGPDDYEALKNALYPETGLVKITVVFDSEGKTIYDSTPINDLKAYLTVTAFYNDGTEQPVNNYAIIGELHKGTCVLEVSYSGKTASFTVTAEISGDWGTDYTWLYLPRRDGLMAINSDKFDAKEPTGNIVEQISGESLHVEGVYDGTEIHRVYNLIPNTITAGVLKFKVKFNRLPPSESSAGLRIKLSNGSKTAALVFGHSLEQNSNVAIAFNGPDQKVLQTNIEMNAWHIVSLEFKGSTQKVTIDSNVYDLNFSSVAGSHIGQIVFQNTPIDAQRPFDLNLDIAWITFKEV